MTTNYTYFLHFLNQPAQKHISCRAFSYLQRWQRRGHEENLLSPLRFCVQERHLSRQLLMSQVSLVDDHTLHQPCVQCLSFKSSVALWMSAHWAPSLWPTKRLLVTITSAILLIACSLAFLSTPVSLVIF